MNKEIDTKEYIQKLGHLKLSDSSRVRIKNNLLEYAQFHSVRVGDDSRSIEHVPRRTSFITNIFNLNKKSMMAAIITFMLIAGGGTSYAAEGAVPGDSLYTVKVEINENIKSAFAISNESEARLQARLAEERLREAEELAVRGELNAENSAELSSRLKGHYEAVETRSAADEARGDYESSAVVRASLEGSLRSYADVLSSLNANVSGNNGASLIAEIKTYADTSAQAQLNATATVKTTVDLEQTTKASITSADNLLLKTEAKLTNSKNKMSAEAYAKAEARLKVAVSAQAEAKTQLQAEAYEEAYAATLSAIRINSEVESMINSTLRIELNAGLGVKLNQTLNAETSSNSEKSETKVEAKDDSSEQSNSSADSSNQIEVRSESTLETDVLNTEIKTDTSIQSGLSL